MFPRRCCWGSRLRAGLLSFFLLVGLIPPGWSAGGFSELECRWATGPVEIDGKGDEPAWAGAQVVEDFQMPWLAPGAAVPALPAVRARLLWDRDYLYFLAEIEDADLQAVVHEHDGHVWEDDAFELFFRPSPSKPGYYEFEVNPLNTTLDMYLPSVNAGGYDKHRSNGAFHFKTAVTLRGTLNDPADRDSGWTVEGRLPWRDFLRTGGRPEPGEVWTCNLAHVNKTRGQEGWGLTSAAPLTQPNFHQIEHYRPIRFVGPAVTQEPWVGSRVVGSPDAPAKYKAVPAFPKLAMTLPLHIFAIPGTDQLLLIEHTQLWGGHTKIRRFRNDALVSSAEEMLDLDGFAYGLAFHPGWATNGYVYFGENGPAQADPKYSRAVRYTMLRQAPWTIDTNSRTVVIEWLSNGHNGADVCFGNDGMLYVTSGDGTSDSDANIAGQDLSKLTSKVLRLDVDHPAAGSQYGVPIDNPFVGQKDVRPETWAYGLRNPWRITSDKVSGQIWVGENGQDLWEYARLLQKGANYGWSVYEGSHIFYRERKMGPQPLTPPTIEHSHSEFRSLTGGVVYRGRKFPELLGAYIYGDYSTGKIRAARHDGEKVVWSAELVDTPYDITGIGQDADGEVLVVGHSTTVYRLELNQDPPPATPFPRHLSETGLFEATASLKPARGVLFYRVNAPVWSDGSRKERLLGLPGGAKVEMTSSRGWNFPEGTVLAQTFTLDGEEGNLATRRRIETRLLTRQQGEWAGYTYVWNAAQTDADLLDEAGLDQSLELSAPSAPGGKRLQPWRYPSRAECMTCHSRAANYVLGINESQLNRPVELDGTGENQLVLLERHGLLKVPAMGYLRDVFPREIEAAGLTGAEKEAELAALAQGEGQREAGVSALLPRSPDRMRRFPSPYDAKAELEPRARAYLSANCSHCHVESGGGNSQLDFDLLTPRTGMKAIDVAPVHSTFGLPQAKIIAPGNPGASVLIYRISHRGDGHMPPLGTLKVDSDAVQMLSNWIAKMPKGGDAKPR